MSQGMDFDDTASLRSLEPPLSIPPERVRKAVAREFVHTGIIGLDDILGGVRGPNGRVRGRLQGERLLIVGPPGAGKTVLALALLYQALKTGSAQECGLLLTTEQTAGDLVDSVAGLFMADLRHFVDPARPRLDIIDFPPIDPPSDANEEQTAPLGDRAIVDKLLGRLREVTWEAERTPRPRHIVLDGLTAMQMVLGSRAEARRLTQLLIATLSFPRFPHEDSFDLIVMTAEAHAGFTERQYSERFHDSFDEYLFDTVIYLDILETPAARRLRTIEIPKSRGRHARTGRHTFSIVSRSGLPSLIHSQAAQQEIQAYDTPVIIFPREPRSERPIEAGSALEPPGAEYLKTGIAGLDALLDREQQRGLLKRSTTVLIGGPGTGSSLLGLRYLAQGLDDAPEPPVLLVSFGRDWEDFALLANNFPWLRKVMERNVQAFHFLYYRPVNLDQNRLFYELRQEIETYHIDRVLVDSLSSLPLVDIHTESSSDFLVTLIGLLKELRCTAMLSYAASQPPEPLAAPGWFLHALADNIFILQNTYDPHQDMKKTLFILKARGTDAVQQEVEFSIGEDLAVRKRDDDERALA